MGRALHIGIVACSAEGASLCHRTICAEGEARLGAHAHPELSLHSHALADYVACLDRADLDGIATLMLDSAHRLAAAGADFLICPDNTIHAALPRVRERSPRPWLHIAEVVAAEVVRRGLRAPALLGTRWLVTSDVYPEALRVHGLAALRPESRDLDVVHGVIMEELVRGEFRPGSVAALREVVDRLRDAGADAVILGCTELPLVLDDRNASLPTLDSTRLLARAAVERALAI